MASPVTPWRAFVRRYVIALGVSVVLVTGGLVVGNRVIDDKLSDIPRINGLQLPKGPGKAGNYLLIGSDARDPGESAAAAKAFGTAAETGPPKSDTLMVVHIDPDAKTSLLVSFPRDLLVDIPGRGRSKINAAFNDGPQKVIDTLRQNFNIEINHYVEVNFQAFVGIVDAIGKVPVYFTAPARDVNSGLNIPTPGCISLDGQQSLEYVRSRHLEYFNAQTGHWDDASPRADLDRITRQQNFIRRLAAEAAHKGASNPLTALEVADATIPKLKIDAQLDKADLFRLINTFRKVNPNDDSAIEMLTIPNKPAPDGASVLIKQPDADEVLARLRTFGGPQTPTDSKLLPSQVRVRVLNASGVEGAAGTTLAGLQQYSFAPAGVGNTRHLSSTEIHYRPGNEDKAKLVAQYLKGGGGQLVSDSSISDTDVVVMVGENFAGVVTKARSSKTSSTTKSKSTATTRTTAPAAPAC